jgi:predicted N-acetyltransferase YhbS
MEMALSRAAELGHRGIILVGDPEYYERFGFTGAPTGNLLMPAPVARRRFLAVELLPKALADTAGLIVATGTRIAALKRIAA